MIVRTWKTVGAVVGFGAALSPVLGVSGIDDDQFVFQKPCLEKGFAPEGEYVWEKITPTKTLVWYDCYSSRQCARLLDSFHVPNQFSRLRGPVLFNPGGPGGSGVDSINKSGDVFVRLLGPQYDIVGFDPRGIARSTPKAQAFLTQVERELWEADIENLDVGTGDAGVAHTWARAQVIGKLAAERSSDFVKHINTENTARDMLRITEAHGKSKLQYWGFSYGSICLNPAGSWSMKDKIERLIIDGVADAEDYFATAWSNNLIDTDKTMQAFYDGCYSAGPQGCPFYASSPGQIQQKLSALYDSVAQKPIAVVTDISYGLLDITKLKDAVFTALYAPYARFHQLAQGLADLENGNATAIYQMSEKPSFGFSCGPSPLFTSSVNEGTMFVSCTDGRPIPGDLDYAKKRHEEMSRSSQWGGLWSVGTIRCSGWPQFTRTHFQGPFVANTSFPILLIGNTADPVTPLWATEDVQRFQKLYSPDTGHARTLFAGYAIFMYDTIILWMGPCPIGTICAATGSPWPRLEAQMLAEESLSQKDWDLLQATRELSRNFQVPRML